jgi:hypothetical protein
MTDAEIEKRLRDARTMLDWLIAASPTLNPKIKYTWATHAGNSLLEIAEEMKRRIGEAKP